MDDKKTTLPNPADILKNIADAELTLLKGPLNDFAAALQQPGANLLTLQNEVANLGLAIPQEAGPAQSAALNIIGANIQALIASIGTNQSPPPPPAEEKSAE